MKNYYKITIAKTGIDIRDIGKGADITYITASDDETAKAYAEDQAANYGCSQSNYKHVLNDEIDINFDRSSIVDIN